LSIAPTRSRNTPRWSGDTLAAVFMTAFNLSVAQANHAVHDARES
jgi:hypothetical protein